MVECRIPGHITGLYIFAVVNLCALLNISLVNADVYVLNIEKNSTITVMKDKQAMFGADFGEDGLTGRLVYVVPHNACERVDPPPSSPAPGDLPWIALIARGPCHFDKKVWEVQKANFSAAIIHNYAGDDSLTEMGGDEYEDKIHIPAVFVGYTDGMNLARNYNYTSPNVLIKLDEFIENFNYFWPFTIVVSICFLGVIVFSIVKCIRYLQHRRRTRLSKTALRKIPTRKYKKGDHYDVCAICLDDYEEGEKLRVLPCDHTYHCKCIDPWLTKRKKTCPQCKRRVIPGQDTDSESENEGEGEGATENTPLLRNNNSRSPVTTQSHGRTSTFERSGLPAVVQPEVVVINEGRRAASTGVVQDENRKTEEDEVEENPGSDEELEGAVGGVGISDQQEFVDKEIDVIVEVEPVCQESSRQTSENTAEPSGVQSMTETLIQERYSPARAEGSINAAFTSSASSEDDQTGASGRRGKKKKRKSNQVI